MLLQAARYRNDADICDLTALKRAMYEDPTHQEEVLTSVWALHRRIAEITPNTFLKIIYLSLIDYLPDHVTVEASPEIDDPDAFAMERIRVHAELVDAIESGDEERMRAAIVAHEEPLH